MKFYHLHGNIKKLQKIIHKLWSIYFVLTSVRNKRLKYYLVTDKNTILNFLYLFKFWIKVIIIIILNINNYLK